MNFARNTLNRGTPIVQITWLVSEKWYSIHKCSASLYTPAKPAKPKAGVQIPLQNYSCACLFGRKKIT